MSNTDDLYEAGLNLRRDMFGAAGADDRINAATDFTRPLEDMVTTYCFGDIWNRPGLDRKTRSLVTLAALIALCRPNQIKGHVQGAIANGATKEEIRELILHISQYAGIPAAVEASGAAREVLAKLGME